MVKTNKTLVLHSGRGVTSLFPIIFTVTCSLSCGSSSDVGQSVQIRQGDPIPEKPGYSVRLVAPKENQELKKGETIDCLIEVDAPDGNTLPRKVLIEVMQDKRVIDSSFAKPSERLGKDRFLFRSSVKMSVKTGKCVVRARAISYLKILATDSDTVLRTITLAAESAPIMVNVKSN